MMPLIPIPNVVSVDDAQKVEPNFAYSPSCSLLSLL
jgi:hypothetical protein